MSLPAFNDQQLRALRRLRTITEHGITLHELVLRQVLGNLTPNELLPLADLSWIEDLSSAEYIRLEERIMNLAQADYKAEFDRASFPDTIPIDTDRRWQRIPFPEDDLAYHVGYSLSGGLPLGHRMVTTYSHLKGESLSLGRIEYFRDGRQEGELIDVAVERIDDVYSWNIMGGNKIIEPHAAPHILELIDILKVLPAPFQTQFWPIYALAPFSLEDSIGTFTLESPSNYLRFEYVA